MYKFKGYLVNEPGSKRPKLKTKKTMCSYQVSQTTLKTTNKGLTAPTRLSIEAEYRKTIARNKKSRNIYLLELQSFKLHHLQPIQAQQQLHQQTNR